MPIVHRDRVKTTTEIVALNSQAHKMEKAYGPLGWSFPLCIGRMAEFMAVTLQPGDSGPRAFWTPLRPAT